MIKLSILIPSVFERDPRPLLQKLRDLIGDQPVEILMLVDNWRRYLGGKRNVLLDAAQGRFITWIDDDDMVDDRYIGLILAAIEINPDCDVVVFNQQSQLLVDNLPENPFIVRAGIEYTECEPAHVVGDKWADITRPPWHWCVFRSDLAKSVLFPRSKCADDDCQWLKQLWPKLKHQIRIDQVLYYYQYSKSSSLAGVYSGREQE